MMYSKSEMYCMLMDYAGIPEESLEMAIRLLGDTPQTYIKILNSETEYQTFEQLENDYYMDE